MKTLGTGMKALFDCLAYFHRVFGTTVVLSHLTGHVIGLWSEREKGRGRTGVSNPVDKGSR